LARGTILYATFDGVLQPLAFSQVVRVITALARRGVRYHLLSVESKRDLEDRRRVDEVQRVLAEANVPWTTVPVDLKGSVLRSGEAFSRIVAQAMRIVSHSNVSLLHARGYQASAVAHFIHRLTRLPYLFDARGCWIEERVDWFSSPVAYATAKWVERALYRDAAAVVTLTALHANDVIDGAFGRKDAKTVSTIPTCADYSEFDIVDDRLRTPHDAVPAAIRDRLRGKVVLGIVGAMNRSYLAQPTMTLVRQVCELRPQAHLLILTQQEREYRALAAASGIPEERLTVTSVRHQDMPGWLPWLNWGLLLLSDTIAKRGSMPTKLAEFFACGVRPVAYGCNSEMTGWVRRAASGVVLDTVQEDDLHHAARHIADTVSNIDTLRRARELTGPHFSLASGIERYEALYGRLV
jgi:hypothetical protein